MSYSIVLTHGRFYYPATSHYNKKPGELNVICDRCQRQHIMCCVGYNDIDLCMPCVEIVADIAGSFAKQEVTPHPKPEVLTFMMQDVFSTRLDRDKTMSSLPPIIRHSSTVSRDLMTRMMQDSFTGGRSEDGISVPKT